MKITIGFSPCPNDTFIFDALINKKIDLQGLTFEPVLEDVQTLNAWAQEGRLDVTKISYGALPKVLGQYRLLESGGALGMGAGPLLIGQRPLDEKDIEAAVNKGPIAIPGVDTTAHLLFAMAFPEALNKTFCVFNEIEQAVADGKAAAGVIIHENRFTYRQKGLHLWKDLGAHWEQATGGPVPLGGIVAHQRLPEAIALTIDELIRQSLQHAFNNYPVLPPFVTDNAQEMDPTVMRQHIDLYVNPYSLGLGPDGHKAVDKLIDTYRLLRK